tara:strand:- start:2408 stop:4762 length:2355 start_codon:yes stop_codon:yes gene_type:complete
MAGYTRQSSADIITGAVVKAAPLNAEFNKLKDIFDSPGVSALGHRHDNSTGEGGYVPLIADANARNKVVTNNSNDTIEFYVEVSSTAAQQLTLADGVFKPVTDNDIALGTSSLGWSDVYIANDGMVNFRDAAIFIKSDVDGKLNITADAEVEINATAIDINGTVNMSGLAYPSSDGTAGQLLKTDGEGTLSFVAASSPSAAGTNTQVQFNDGGTQAGAATFTFAKGTGAITTAAGTLPTGYGTNGQVLTTNGSGQTSWAALSAGSASITITDDVSSGAEKGLLYATTTGATTNTIYTATGGSDDVTIRPDIGRISAKNFNLGSGGNGEFSSTNNGDISIFPHGTGDLKFNDQIWPDDDGIAGQFLKTNGSNVLSWANVSGTGSGSGGPGDPVNGCILSLINTDGAQYWQSQYDENHSPYHYDSSIKGTSLTSLYLVPYRAGFANIYIEDQFREVNFSSIPSVTISANTTPKAIYAYWTGSAVGIEAVAYDTGYPVYTAGTYGRWTKNGDTTRTLCGWAYNDGTATAGRNTGLHFMPYGKSHGNTMTTQGRHPASISFTNAYNARPITLSKSNLLWGDSFGRETTKTGLVVPRDTDFAAGTTPNSNSLYSQQTVTGATIVPVFSPGNAVGTNKSFTGRVQWMQNLMHHGQDEVECKIYWSSDSTDAATEYRFFLRGGHFDTYDVAIDQSLTLAMTDAVSHDEAFGHYATAGTIRETTLKYTVPLNRRMFYEWGSGHDYGYFGGYPNAAETSKSAGFINQAGLYACLHGSGTMTIRGMEISVKTQV